VIDERVLYYLQHEIEKLLEVSGGEGLKQYSENICNIGGRLKNELPVYDSEVRWS
jgi:hypothetical protein